MAITMLPYALPIPPYDFLLWGGAGRSGDRPPLTTTARLLALGASNLNVYWRILSALESL